ncbi:hypothetical protein G6F37_005024 [Rhizopus arrhizus]|nr:hypothetical protein G6F38_003674 [Rhizopus arrhizus]KAG1159302.1 hypothetical protein G6F37_005024 [Rhizopus arrhizus]
MSFIRALALSPRNSLRSQKVNANIASEAATKATISTVQRATIQLKLFCILIAHITGDEHHKVATEVQQILQNSKPLQDTITVLAIQCFLSQPFAVAHVFAGYRAHPSMLQDTIGFFKEILGDKDDVLLETAFYMEGNINSILKMS